MNKRTGSATQRWLPRVSVLVLLLAIGLAGCGPSPTPTVTPTLEPTPTQPPTATPEPTPPSPPAASVIYPAGEITVEAGKKLAIHASAAGADRYEWTLQGDGQISATTGDAIIYIASEEEGAMAILTVNAYNDQGASPPTSLIISVAPTASIRLEALAIPAGWMSGGGSPEPFISLGGGSPNDCYTGAHCFQVTYDPGGMWGGIFWWPLSCGESGTTEAWGRVQKGTCGINVLEAGNLSAVKRLTFWARGDKGGEVVEFKIGAMDVLPSPGRSLGRVTLTSNWEQYEIDPEGMDLTNAIGVFAWIADDVSNPQGAVFYLDDIQFEGVK